MNRIIIFFLIGCFRGVINHENSKVYSCKYTSFQADVIDYQIRENKSYLLLNNFKYISKNSLVYTLDEYAIFPKEALMEVENIEKYGNAKTIEAIGRMYLPMSISVKPMLLYKPRGIIKHCSILNEKSSTLKHYLRQKFKKFLSEDSASFCCAIFLGDTFSIKKDTRKIFEKAGLAHILGVSILNLSIVLIFLFYIFYYLIGLFYLRSSNFLPISVSSKLISLVFMLGYCYLIGFEYPLLRTFFMSGISIFLLFYIGANYVETLLLSACIVLLIDPSAIYDLSFQLSFGGVLGIFALSHVKFKNWILSSFWTTLSAISLIGPISIFQFQQMCFQPFLANFLVLPFLSFILIPSLLIFICSPYFICKILAHLINFEFILLQKMVIFLSKIALNMHFLPVFYPYFLIFFVFFLIFSMIKEKIRYWFLMIGYAIFIFGMVRSFYYFPFLLVNSGAIGLVLSDKILVYPKCGVIGDIWSEYYNLPAFDGENIGVFKNDNGRIIVHNIGIIRRGKVGEYAMSTKKDYVFLPGELIDKTQVIYLSF